MSSTPIIPFRFPPLLAPLFISPDAYLAANPALAGLIVSAIVIQDHRVLLIQRAAHDGFPLKWECPGGQVDQTDQTVLHGLCREVHEETGLEVKCVEEVADMLEFEGREGGNWRKLTFLVALEDGEIPVVQLVLTSMRMRCGLQTRKWPLESVMEGRSSLHTRGRRKLCWMP